MPSHQAHDRRPHHDRESRHILLVGSVRVPLPASEALHLFTPVGEKVWADGWDPQFVEPLEADGSQPGTVFEVAHGGDRSVWVVCRCEPPHTVRYARVVQGKNAGTVTVTVAAESDGSVATIEYDLTALSDAGAVGLADFAAHYPEYLAWWETAIDRAFGRPRGALRP